MKIPVTLYRWHDADIVSLALAGYPVMSMMSAAVCAYAKGESIHFLIDSPVKCDFNNLKTLRKLLTIPDSEKEAIAVLFHIKRGFRNSFCRTVFRNALVVQNVSCLFADESLAKLQSVNLSHIKNEIPKDAILLSSVQNKTKLKKHCGSNVLAIEGIDTDVDVPVVSAPKTNSSSVNKQESAKKAPSSLPPKATPPKKETVSIEVFNHDDVDTTDNDIDISESTLPDDDVDFLSGFNNLL